MDDRTIISASPAMQRALYLVRAFAPGGMPILLVGPTGAGKEVLAQEIHRQSRRAGVFAAVNCAALPRDLVEGELFGHRRGAFSGALADQVGYIEAADRGTLLLDELTSMPLESQAKLLRAIEDGAVTRLGETRARSVDVRFLAAIQADTAREAGRTSVRIDLIFRLSGVVIELPPLRSRPADVIALAHHFAGLAGRRLAIGVDRVLLQHQWPGNIRELKRVVERAMVLVPHGVVCPSTVAEAFDLGAQPTAREGDADDGASRAALIAVLKDVGWHAARAAARLGIGRATLFRRLDAVGLSITAARQSHQSHQSRYGLATTETIGSTFPADGIGK